MIFNFFVILMKKITFQYKNMSELTKKSQSVNIELSSVEQENEKAILIEIEKHSIPVFSANELGKVTITLDHLTKDTGFDYSQIPIITTKLKEVYEIFHNYPKVNYLPFSDEKGWIVGYFTRKGFLSLVSEGNYNRELLLGRNTYAKDFLNKNIVCLNAFTTLNEASEIIMNRPYEILFDPFVVTLERKFYGIATVDRVLKGINAFLKKDLDSVKRSQFFLNQFFSETNVENNLDYIDHIEYIHGPGGDFVCNYDLNEQYAIICLFDVCGKGIKASSFVFVMGTLINKMVQKLKESDEINAKKIQREIFTLNNELVNSTLEELYTTGVILLINKIDKIISIFDFGHSLLWVIRNQKPHKLKTHQNENMNFLGVMKNIKFPFVTYQLKKEDLIFSCSDGITEQMNDEKRMYMDNIETILKEFDSDLMRNKKILLEDWNQFRNRRKIRDDISFFILKL